MMTMKKTTVQLQLGCEPCILLQSTCTTTYQVTTHVKQSICLHKQAACPSNENSEIYCPQKFPAIQYYTLIVIKQLWNFIL